MYHFLLECLLFLACAWQIAGQHQDSWSVYEYPNPLTDVDSCGRYGEVSYICDPSNILKPEEARQLEAALWSIRNETACPCSNYVCTQQKDGGYKIGIAIVKKMKPEFKTQSNGDEKLNLDDSLHEVSLFAYTLLQSWRLGMCSEDAIIVYSAIDNVFYTMVGEVTGKKLTRSKLGYIAMNTRGLYSPSSVFKGLFELVKQYKAVFLGVYKKPDYALPKAAAITGGGHMAQQSIVGLLLPLAMLTLWKFF